jgi:hypothetical protein
VGDFSEGLASVLVDGKWGYIDKTGQIEIEPQFKTAIKFGGGLALVEIDDKNWGYIDRKGIFVWKSK